MLNIIIRKPKFMRNEAVMIAYMKCANSFGSVLTSQDVTLDEQYETMKKIGECINEAAKAGGFFSTKDFIKWMEKHKAII